MEPRHAVGDRALARCAWLPRSRAGTVAVGVFVALCAGWIGYQLVVLAQLQQFLAERCADPLCVARLVDGEHMSDLQPALRTEGLFDLAYPLQAWMLWTLNLWLLFGAVLLLALAVGRPDRDHRDGVQLPGWMVVVVLFALLTWVPSTSFPVTAQYAAVATE